MEQSMSTMVVPGNSQPCGYEQIPCNTAQSLTVPNNARWAIFKAEAQTVRIRDDGTDPTATVGLPLGTSDSLFYSGNLSGVRVIAATAGGILNVLYYG
jgi:hypothetical protein